jgi:hypothetical protein
MLEQERASQQVPVFSCFAVLPSRYLSSLVSQLHSRGSQRIWMSLQRHLVPTCAIVSNSKQKVLNRSAGRIMVVVGGGGGGHGCKNGVSVLSLSRKEEIFVNRKCRNLVMCGKHCVRPTEPAAHKSGYRVTPLEFLNFIT